MNGGPALAERRFATPLAARCELYLNQRQQVEMNWDQIKERQ